MEVYLCLLTMVSTNIYHPNVICNYYIPWFYSCTNDTKNNKKMSLKFTSRYILSKYLNGTFHRNVGTFPKINEKKCNVKLKRA